MYKYLVLAFLISGCETLDETRNFQIDSSFSIDEQVMIRSYLDQLSIKTGQYIGTSVGITSDRKIIVRVPGLEGGLWYPGSRKIEIGTKWTNPETTAAVVAHEMGHDMGFGHVGGDSLMAPVYVLGSGMRWSAEDQAECERVQICGSTTKDQVMP